MALKNCSHCGKPSVPGLKRGVALCLYHYNVWMFGKAWADHVETTGRKLLREFKRDLEE